MQTVYLNGEFLKEDEAKISIFDRGFVLGDGIYEVVPIIEGKLVDKDGFWERFVRSLGEIKLAPPMGKDEYIKMLTKLAELNQIKEGAVYTQLTRGVAPRVFYFPKDLKPTVTAFCYAVNVLNNPQANEGIKVISVEDIRWKRRDIKSISLLGQCVAKEIVHEAGAFEGFMVENGHVTEGVSSSAYIVKDGVVITTPLSNEILPGVRRKNLIKIAKNLGIKMEFRYFTIDEVKSADEAFVSSATLLVMPVTSIDDELINGGKVGEISMRLREAYKQKYLQEVKN